MARGQEEKEQIKQKIMEVFDGAFEDGKTIRIPINGLEIKITLTANDDEQKIFDSVNSMGKTLSNADIIKNYIFQKIKSNNTTKEDNDKLIDAYNKYWDSVFYENEKKEFWYQDFTVGRIKTDNLECFLKDFAFRIWSPRLAAADKGIRSAGFCKARSSQMALAPALEIIISAIAKRCFRGSLIYSYCT